MKDQINFGLRKLGLVATVFMLIITSALTAAYFESLDAEITNPDGTTIKCFVSGDEFFNWYHDKDGYTIIMGDDAYYYYGVESNGNVIPSQHRVNTVNPSSVGLKKWAKISEQEYQRRRDFFDERIERADTRAPHSGTMLNLVVFIRFADDPEFSGARSSYDKILNNTEVTSLRNYYRNVSYNKLDIVSHFFPVHDNMNSNISYKDEMPRKYFQPYSSANPTGYNGEEERREREHSLLKRAVEFIEDQISDDLVIDLDNDGYVDTMSFIIYGGNDGWAQLLWAHRWVLHSYIVKLKGKRVWDYTFQPSSQTDVKTMCHEMFHSLGAPDLYRYGGGGAPVGTWDLMESGFGHMGAWMKYRYSKKTWIENIPEITTSGTYSISPLFQSENNAYIIRSAFSPTEFFVLEYRNKNAPYESSLPGTGLLVYRINDRYEGNAEGPPDEVYLYRPNGNNMGGGNLELAHYGAHVNRTAINDTTTNPKSFLTDGSNGGLYIYDISDAGETMTFSVTMIGVLEPPLLNYPANNALDVLITPSFSWQQVNVAQYYGLQIATDESFENIVFEDEDIKDTQYTVNTRLDIETPHYWRIRTHDEEEWSEWSHIRKFTTTHFSPIEQTFVGVAYGSTLWGDFDNDGYLDLFTSGNNTTKIYMNQGDGKFEALNQKLPELKFVGAALGDLNNDGWLDFIITGKDKNNTAQTYIYLNNGMNEFTEFETSIIGLYNSSVALGDYNNDGWLDILLTGDSSEGKITTIYKNNSGTSFTRMNTPNLPGVNLGEAAWGDFNNDGWLDIALTGTMRQGSVSEIYLNNEGNGTFTPLNANLIPLQGSSLDLSDFNNDGWLDIALTGTSTSGLATKIYQNNGDGTFLEVATDIPGYAVGDLKWGDMNSDGYPDLLMSGFTPASAFRNVEGQFEMINSGLPTVSLSTAAWGDFDNDGDLDVVISGSTLEGMTLEVYRNELGDNTFKPNTPPTTPSNPSSSVCRANVTLTWDQSEDKETPTTGLTYNVSISSASGSEDILSSMSDLETGYRRVLRGGNNGNRTELIILDLPEGTYYWRVQAVDGALTGSKFTNEQVFTITDVSADDVTITPFATELIGNHPNPFNPETTIQFSLSSDSNIKVSIYNIAGQKVKTVLNDTLKAGKHTVKWNGKNDDNQEVGSGIYFYRLETKEKTQTKKMLLLK